MLSALHSCVSPTGHARLPHNSGVSVHMHAVQHGGAPQHDGAPQHAILVLGTHIRVIMSEEDLEAEVKTVEAAHLPRPAGHAAASPQETHPPVHVFVCHSVPTAWGDGPTTTAHVHCPPRFLRHAPLTLVNASSETTTADATTPAQSHRAWVAGVRRRHYAVGRTMFETDGLPQQWLMRINAPRVIHEVWVPSNFNRESFSRCHVRKRLTVVHQPLSDWVQHTRACRHVTAREVERGNECGSELGGELGSSGVTPEKRETQESGALRESTTTFLSVFKWERRKGWSVLLEGFLRAFCGYPHVRLLIVTTPW
jgi:hypothetical protein